MGIFVLYLRVFSSVIHSALSHLSNLVLQLNNDIVECFDVIICVNL